MRKPKLKEIAWGPAGDADKTCVYANGHIEPAKFLELAVEFSGSMDSLGYSLEDGLTESDVRHIRFRPMSPGEARSMGYDYGVMEADEEMHRGYPVTAVFL